MTDENTDVDWVEGVVTNDTGSQIPVLRDSERTVVTEDGKRYFLVTTDNPLPEGCGVGDKVEIQYRDANEMEILPVVTDVRKYSAEDNDDSDSETSTMSDNTSYDFVSTDDDEQTAVTTDDGAGRWGLGDHSGANSDDVSEALSDLTGQLDDDVDADVKAVLEDAQSMVSSTSVSSFTCPISECGLQHSHSDTKHDIRSASTGFSVTSEFADRMAFCPYCHCGVNELAMLVRYFPLIDAEVFADRDFGELDGVSTVLLNSIYNEWTQNNDVQLGDAINNCTKSDYFPSEARSQVVEFLQLRHRIQNAADGAPIPTETRQAISDRDDELSSLI